MFEVGVKIPDCMQLAVWFDEQHPCVKSRTLWVEHAHDWLPMSTANDGAGILVTGQDGKGQKNSSLSLFVCLLLTHIKYYFIPNHCTIVTIKPL